METATIKRRMKFTQTGNGPSLILIGKRHRDWNQSVDILSQYFTVIIPTISNEVFTGMDRPDPVHYIRLITEDLQIDKFSLMSDGYGAWTVFDLVRKYPTSITGFVISGDPVRWVGYQQQLTEDDRRYASFKPSFADPDGDFWNTLIKEQIGELKLAKWNSDNQSKGLWILGENEKLKGSLTNVPSGLEKDLDIKIVRDNGGELMKVNPLYFTLLVNEYLSGHLIN
jgi:pimeloyl-ACP methyl ester carboxylesterase